MALSFFIAVVERLAQLAFSLVGGVVGENASGRVKNMQDNMGLSCMFGPWGGVGSFTLFIFFLGRGRWLENSQQWHRKGFVV